MGSDAVGEGLIWPAPALSPEGETFGSTPRRVISPREWAEWNFAGVKLGDRRRNERAVVMAERMAMFPGASLPQQMEGLAGLKASYRFLHREEATLAGISMPHWSRTWELAARHPMVLLVQDFTTLVLTAYAKTMKDLGRVGTGNKGWGMMVHTTLAVLPGTGELVGVAHQQMLARQPLPEGTDYRQRPKEERISRAWGDALEVIGQVPEDTCWVVVADREADNIDFLLIPRRLGYDFLIRVSWDRRLPDEAGETHRGKQQEVRYLLRTARTWSAVAGKKVEVPGHNGRKARDAKLLVSYGEVDLRVPKGEEPLHVWVVRAWEVEAPAEVKEPLEWVLFTTLPVCSAEDALSVLDWYTLRWVVEDYNQCMKTGCGIEEHDFEDVAYLDALLGFVGPLAARLLQLRDCARLNPELPASAVVDELTVRVLAKERNVEPEGMKVRTFWREVARLGGYLGRKCDGEPGWKSLWCGWLRLEALVHGARVCLALIAEADRRSGRREPGWGLSPPPIT
jgi:hypothetical protein